MTIVNAILCWLDQLSTLIVAVLGFITTIVVARLTCTMELRKTLFLKRIEAYETALMKLTLLKNAYANFLNLITEPIDKDILESKIVFIHISLIQFSNIDQQNGDFAKISFYTTIPLHDTFPMLQKMSCFIQTLTEVTTALNTADRQQLTQKINDAINEFRPHAHEEYQYLVNVYDKLLNDIKHEKELKKILNL